MLHLPGALDDNDHMALGDYGNEYGEYRWGVFMRFVWRLFRQASPKPELYFRDQMAVMSLPTEAVFADLRFEFKEKKENDGKLLLQIKSRSGSKFEMTVEEFRSALIRDLSFGLAVHPERLSVEILGGGIARLVVRDVEVQDYPLHPTKQRPWGTWAAYFGRAAPQPLVVVAQTIREKSLMAGDDLSDFYKGRVTQALPEGNVEVTLVSQKCSAFAKALELHRFGCQASQLNEMPRETNVVPLHSVLYSYAAKEKLSGELGIPAESSLRRIFERTGSPLPALAALMLDESSHASFMEFEGRSFTRGGLKSLLKKLPQGYDVLQTSGCKLPKPAVENLVPGGLILIENLDSCSDSDDFREFLRVAARIGIVTVGRNIAVITKFGDFQHSKIRATWPQKRLKAVAAGASQKTGSGDPPFDRLTFLRKVTGIELEFSSDNSSDKAFGPEQLRKPFRRQLLEKGLSFGEVAVALDKLGEAEILFRELDADESGSIDEAEFGKLQEVRKKKKFNLPLTKDAKRAKEEDAEVVRSTPKSLWPKLITAKDVQRDFPLDGNFVKVKDPPTLRAGVDNPCGLQLSRLTTLKFLRHGTREDGQAMVMYVAEVDDRQYIFKLGRFVDLAREALVSQRLWSCGTTSFAKTCGLIAAEEQQDSAGLWREARSWKSKLEIPTTADDLSSSFKWLDFPEVFASDQLGHCQDCLYSGRDAAGSYLKDGSMRAHIELCPAECVVWQVQEFVEGLPLESLAWPYRSDFAPGHDRKEGSDPQKEKAKIQKTVNRWLAAAQVPLREISTDEKAASALTEMVVARIFATFVHLHSKCGIVHDDMHVGNIILTKETGQVKVIDWELARTVQTDRQSLLKLWNGETQHGRRQKPGLINDRATQCDSLFKGCVCQWPWEALTDPGPQKKSAKAACNLFGLKKDASVAVLQALITKLPKLSEKVLGEHGESLKEELLHFSHKESTQDEL